MLRLCIALGVLVSVASPVFGWNKAGHMVSGSIAFEVLQTQNAGVATRAVALLRAHPQFEQLWAQQIAGVPEDQQGRVLFMLAARWPDDIRGDSKYDQPKWHYISFPYRPPGQPESVRTSEPDDPNALVAFRANIRVLEGEASDADKAVALCWVFHLVGDIHQPMHTASLFTTDFAGAGGDQGGTLAFVRTYERCDPISLHKFWDDLVIDSEELQAVQQRGSDLMRLFPIEELHEASQEQSSGAFQDWIAESFQLVKRHVYRDGRVSGTPAKDTAPALDDDYSAFAKYLGNRRVVLASYRLAVVLETSVR